MRRLIFVILVIASAGMSSCLFPQDRSRHTELGIELWGSGNDPAIIKSVVPHSAADLAGLKAGETILRIADNEARTIDEFLASRAWGSQGLEVLFVVAGEDGARDVGLEIPVDEGWPSAAGKQVYVPFELDRFAGNGRTWDAAGLKIRNGVNRLMGNKSLYTLLPCQTLEIRRDSPFSAVLHDGHFRFEIRGDWPRVVFSSQDECAYWAGQQIFDMATRKWLWVEWECDAEEGSCRADAVKTTPPTQ